MKLVNEKDLKMYPILKICNVQIYRSNSNLNFDILISEGHFNKLAKDKIKCTATRNRNFLVDSQEVEQINFIQKQRYNKLKNFDAKINNEIIKPDH